MGKIFVSYARDESKKVYRILNKLKKHGVEFWVDTQDIKNGKDWAEEISKAIRNCRKVLLFMSTLSMTSPNTAQEVKIAFGNNKKFAVLRLDDVKYPTKLKYALEGTQWTDYLSTNWETEIVSALGGGRKYFRKPRGSSTPIARCVPRTQPLPKKLRKPHAILLELEQAFSTSRKYHEDECNAIMLKLEDLQIIVGSHWVNPALAYDELVPRQYVINKLDVIKGLIQEFQETCPPGSPSKRQIIQFELQALIQEFDKVNR
jgi:hypothetical protein